MSEYSEKFKDPRWQKKRLEILERDEFTCLLCGDTENQLHVHHIWYEKGKEPWEYKDRCYITLCETCHLVEHEADKAVKGTSLYALKNSGLPSSVIHDLVLSLHHFQFRVERVFYPELDELCSLIQKIGAGEIPFYDLIDFNNKYIKKQNG